MSPIKFQLYIGCELTNKWFSYVFHCRLWILWCIIYKNISHEFQLDDRCTNWTDLNWFIFQDFPRLPFYYRKNVCRLMNFSWYQIWMRLILFKIFSSNINSANLTSKSRRQFNQIHGLTRLSNLSQKPDEWFAQK